MNSPMFHLRVFGNPAIAGVDGTPLAGPAVQRHRLALLALLACTRGSGVSRDKLLAYLWPERDTEPARQLLNQAVYHLRRALGEAAILSTGEELRLDPRVVACDVIAFEEALAAGEFERSARLYTGPFLDGFFLGESPEFEQWMEQERERLAIRYARALESLASAAEGEGDFPKAVGWWRARAAQDPYDSRVALRLMQALDASGNRAGALQHAAIHERLLQEEFDIAPPPEIQALAERLRRERTAMPAVSGPQEGRTEGQGPERFRAAGPEPGGMPPAEAPPPTSSDALPPSGPVPPAPADEAQRIATAAGAGRTSRWWTAAALLAAVLAGIAGTRSAGWLRDAEPERSIVVLPFVDMSAAEGNEHFSDGLTEEIITRLAMIPELKVISRTSAMHYKGNQKSLRQIAEELKVAHVLEGSVRQGDGRLRITAQLIDARADHHRWAGSYDVEPREIFRVQEEIAREVVGALEVQLTESVRRNLAARGTRDPEAYDLYRRGRYFWGTRTREGHERAFRYYQRAIERDSTYADAYSGLADAYLTAYQFNLTDLPEEEVYSRIKWAAERALALDDQSASAHASFALVLWWQRNWPGAERELRRAMELDPTVGGGWLANLLTGMGRLDEALLVARRSYELQPFVPVAHVNYGWHCYLARDYDCAIEQFQKAIEIDPSLAQAHHMLGLAYSQKGMPEEALRAFGRAAELNPIFLADHAYGLARIGRRQDALETLERAKEKPFEAFYVGRAYVALSVPDSAFAWLERSNWRFPHRANRFDPALDPLRSDPRFAQLSARIEREMGLQ